MTATPVPLSGRRAQAARNDQRIRDSARAVFTADRPPRLILVVVGALDDAHALSAGPLSAARRALPLVARVLDE